MAAVSQVIVRLVLEAAGINEGIQKAASKLADLEQTFERAGSVLSSVGDTMEKAITLPLMGAATAAVAFAQQFENSMNQVQIEGGYTAQEIAKLGDELLKMAADGDRVRESATSLAENLIKIADAGITGSDSLKLLEQSSRLASATMSETSGVIDLALAAMKQLSMTVDDMPALFDKFAAATLAGRVELNALAGGFDNLLVVAKEAGITIDELLAAIAALTNAGFETGEALTALESILFGLMRPTSQTKALMEELGLQSVVTKLQTEGLGATLLALREATDGNTETLMRLTRNMTAVEAVMLLTSDGGRELSAALEQIAHSAGVASEMFATSGQTFQAQFAVFRNTLQSLAIEIGRIILPILTDFLKALQPAIATFGQMSPELQKLIVGFGAFLAVIGPVLSVLGRFFGALSTIRTVIIGIPAAIGAIKAAFAGLGALIAAVGGSVVVVVLAIAAAVVGLYLAWRNNWLGIRDITQNVWQWLISAFGALKAQLAAFAADPAATLQLWRDELIARLQEFAANFPAMVATSWETVKSIIATASAQIATIVATAWEQIKTVIYNALVNIVANILGDHEQAQAIVSAAFANIHAIAEQYWRLLQIGWQIWGEWITSFLQATTPVWSAIWQGFVTFVETTAQMFWETMKTLFSVSMTTIQTIIATTLALIAGDWQMAWQAMRNGVVQIWEEIKQAVGNALNILVAMGGEKAAALRDVVLSTLNFAEEAFGRGLAIAQRFGQGIIAGLQAALDAARRLADEIRALLPGSDAKKGPLSDLLKSGMALPKTFARGMMIGLSDLLRASESMARVLLPEYIVNPAQTRKDVAKALPTDVVTEWVDAWSKVASAVKKPPFWGLDLLPIKQRELPENVITHSVIAAVTKTLDTARKKPIATPKRIHLPERVFDGKDTAAPKPPAASKRIRLPERVVDGKDVAAPKPSTARKRIRLPERIEIGGIGLEIPLWPWPKRLPQEPPERADLLPLPIRKIPPALEIGQKLPIRRLPMPIGVEGPIGPWPKRLPQEPPERADLLPGARGESKDEKAGDKAPKGAQEQKPPCCRTTAEAIKDVSERVGDLAQTLQTGGGGGIAKRIINYPYPHLIPALAALLPGRGSRAIDFPSQKPVRLTAGENRYMLPGWRHFVTAGENGQTMTHSSVQVTIYNPEPRAAEDDIYRRLRLLQVAGII